MLTVCVAQPPGRIPPKSNSVKCLRRHAVAESVASDATGFYFDSATGLCYGMNGHPDYPDDLTREDDYRRVGGILVPQFG